MLLLSREHCAESDKNDPLAAFRDEFSLPQGMVYMCGNSLGAMPKNAAAIAQQTIVEEWGNGLVKSWNIHQWFTLTSRLGGLIAQTIGAQDNEVVMTDVCPYTLGVEVSEMVGRDQTKSGFYLPIIERNSVVPISRSKNLQTLYDNQRNVELSIYQGESRLVRDNIFLGKINVSVPPRPAGEVKLDVRFTYDINGILEAEVTIPLTNDKHRLVIEENPGVMSQEQIELRFAELAQLKIHPRSQAENRAVTARAERIYEQSLGDIRSVVGQAIKEFLDIVEGQNVRDIHEARLRLIALLDKIDSADWL